MHSQMRLRVASSILTESESRGPSLLRINYAVRFGRQQGGAGMNLRLVDRSKSRFAAYVEGLVSVIGHADRASPLRDYCLGLIMPCERKSVEQSRRHGRALDALRREKRGGRCHRAQVAVGRRARCCRHRTPKPGGQRRNSSARKTRQRPGPSLLPTGVPMPRSRASCFGTVW
jgi:hypothetical protein